jgi:hypothetical protein
MHLMMCSAACSNACDRSRAHAVQISAELP